MARSVIVVLLGLVAALFLGNVIEISFHPDRLQGLPAAISSAIQDGSVYEKTRTLAIRAKRSVEQFIIRDERQRFEIALLYVTTDSERLRELTETENNWDADKLLLQAKLLAASLEQVHIQSITVPVDALASLKDESQQALLSAQEAFTQLKDVQENYADLKEQLAQTTTSLETQIGKFDLTESEVAGDQDGGEKNENESSTPIPLKF